LRSTITTESPAVTVGTPTSRLGRRAGHDAALHFTSAYLDAERPGYFVGKSVTKGATYVGRS